MLNQTLSESIGHHKKCMICTPKNAKMMESSVCRGAKGKIMQHISPELTPLLTMHGSTRTMVAHGPTIRNDPLVSCSFGCGSVHVSFAGDRKILSARSKATCGCYRVFWRIRRWTLSGHPKFIQFILVSKLGHRDTKLVVMEAHFLSSRFGLIQ